MVALEKLLMFLEGQHVSRYGTEIIQKLYKQLDENEILELKQNLMKLPPEPTGKLEKTKVGCVFLMVAVRMLNRAKFGRNDHRVYALHFTLRWFEAEE